MRSRLTLISLALASALLLGACLFDSGVEWRSGRYALVWVDLSEDVYLAHGGERGNWGILVEPRVFAVGANERYVVAKQHPGGDKTVTNYFIVDKLSGSPNLVGTVVGPLSEAAFHERASLVSLPEFTKTLEDLQ